LISYYDISDIILVVLFPRWLKVRVFNHKRTLPSGKTFSEKLDKIKISFVYHCLEKKYLAFAPELILIYSAIVYMK